MPAGIVKRVAVLQFAGDAVAGNPSARDSTRLENCSAKYKVLSIVMLSLLNHI